MRNWLLSKLTRGLRKVKNPLDLPPPQIRDRLESAARSDLENSIPCFLLAQVEAIH